MSSFIIWEKQNSTLHFYNNRVEPTQATYDDVNITQLFSLENEYTDSLFVYEYMKIREQIKSVIIHDRIAPRSVTGWFAGFRNCVEFIGLDNIDVSSVRDFCFMFSNCFSIRNLDISTFNWTKAEEMIGMFSGCHQLEKLIVSNDCCFINLHDVSEMFNECYKLKLDCSDWRNLSKTVAMKDFNFDAHNVVSPSF